jgi:hypothetical protein
MKDYFPAVEHGAQGSRTGHDLLQGNYESDFPGETMFSFYQVSPDVNWHDHEELQTVHALRNFPQGQLRNLNDSIRDIRAIITRVTHTALEKFSASDRKGGLYFAGHAVHIIQDSFSPSHAVREDVRSQILRDICTYGKRFAGVCYHKKVAIGDDRVWKENFRCTVNPAERDVTCLKDLAQQAVLATAGYLIVLARLESGQENDRATTLGRYFEDESSSVYSGYFRIEPTFLSGP